MERVPGDVQAPPGPPGGRAGEGQLAEFDLVNRHV
jgi:hypothetical protein